MRYDDGIPEMTPREWHEGERRHRIELMRTGHVFVPPKPTKGLPIETCDGERPKLRFESVAAAAYAMQMTCANFYKSIRSGTAAAGRRWRFVQRDEEAA